MLIFSCSRSIRLKIVSSRLWKYSVHRPSYRGPVVSNFRRSNVTHSDPGVSHDEVVNVFATTVIVYNVARRRLSCVQQF
jgi:hypothetical protein